MYAFLSPDYFKCLKISKKKHWLFEHISFLRILKTELQSIIIGIGKQRNFRKINMKRRCSTLRKIDNVRHWMLDAQFSFFRCFCGLSSRSEGTLSLLQKPILARDCKRRQVFVFFLFLPDYKQNWKVSTNLSESFINGISQKSILWESVFCIGKGRKRDTAKQEVACCLRSYVGSRVKKQSFCLLACLCVCVCVCVCASVCVCIWVWVFLYMSYPFKL